jgi:hypothetical protein
VRTSAGREARRFLDHLEFDGQAVAVPARHEGRVKPGHGLRFHDQVLEDLVQRGAHVDVAIGEGRAVVQDEFRGARPAGASGCARTGRRCFPFFQALGLALDEVGLHREVRSSAGGRCLCSYAGGATTLIVNQQQEAPLDRLWRPLGVFYFAAGRAGWVRVGNEGTEADKVVIADAVQWLPVGEAEW